MDTRYGALFSSFVLSIVLLFGIELTSLGKAALFFLLVSLLGYVL